MGFQPEFCRGAFENGSGVVTVTDRSPKNAIAPETNLGKPSVQRIVFPESKDARARKVVTRSRSRATGKFPSWKMGRMMQWESANELNAFRLLDSDPSVIRFSEQPCEIHYVIEGLPTKHYPDILVEMHGRKELWEVKPEAQASRPEIVQRTACLATSLDTWGYTYRVVLAGDLAIQPRLDNAKLLLRFGRSWISTVERESLRRLLRGSGPVTWCDASSGVLGTRGRTILARLVLEGVLHFDWNTPIQRSTTFGVNKGAL